MVSNEGKANVIPRVQFLSFDGCPLAEKARAALERALQACGMNTDQYELIDLLDPATPANLASWGSPTILLNGRDVTGQGRGDGVGCRIYDTSDQVPTAATIAAAIQKSVKA